MNFDGTLFQRELEHLQPIVGDVYQICFTDELAQNLGVDFYQYLASDFTGEQHEVTARDGRVLQFRLSYHRDIVRLSTIFQFTFTGIIDNIVRGYEHRAPAPSKPKTKFKPDPFSNKHKRCLVL